MLTHLISLTVAHAHTLTPTCTHSHTTFNQLATRQREQAKAGEELRKAMLATNASYIEGSSAQHDNYVLPVLPPQNAANGTAGKK